MNKTHTMALVLGLALGWPTAALRAQNTEPATTVSPTRSQVKMETKEFLRTHRWDESAETWLLKSGVEPPTGVVSRATVRAQREEFVRLNRWDERSATWIPRRPAPATVNTLTRAQVRAETRAFMRTHTWDEDSETWVMNVPVKTR